LWRAELHRLVIEEGVTDASASTIWRWLHHRSLKPWQQRSWIFPRDPDFQPKAGRVLDLHARRFEGRLLHPGEYVICADEKLDHQLPVLRVRDLPVRYRPHARRPEGDRAVVLAVEQAPPGRSELPRTSDMTRA
jgi:hypothetical protein